MKLGIFGGAFNPVHNGHINLAEKYIDLLDLDLLCVIPTGNPPHRTCRDFAPAQARFAMLKAAFSGNQKVLVSDLEFRRRGKSYTYDTVQILKKEYPAAQLFLIVGEDQFLKFEAWYRYSDILANVTLCTAAREENARKRLLDFSKSHFSGSRVYIADFEPVVVSSSEIRDKIKKNYDISGLVPTCVLDYIKEKGLYVDGF